MAKLGEITVNGKQVSVFEPPHDEPDFPWVDVEELAKAFLPRARARRIVALTHKFGEAGRDHPDGAEADGAAGGIADIGAHRSTWPRGKPRGFLLEGGG